MQRFIHSFAIATKDPGLNRLGHALGTVGGVGLTYLIIHAFNLPGMVFGLIASAILAQCTVGNTLKQRKSSMAIAGFGGGILALIGSLITYQHPFAGYFWMAIVAFFAYLLANLGGRFVVMPRFVTVLVIFGSVIPLPFPEMGSAALAYGIGFVSAFGVYFYLLPDHKLPFLQSSLHLTFGRIADMIEQHETHASMREAEQVASKRLDSAGEAMEEARNGGWNQGDLVDAASELVLTLRELYTDAHFIQRFLAHLVQEGKESERFFAIGRAAARGLRGAGVAINIASHRSTLPVYEAIDKLREELEEIVRTFEEVPLGTKQVPTVVRAANFVAAGQHLGITLTRAATLIDRLQNPTKERNG